MLARQSLVRTVQVFCTGAAATLVSLAPASPASAATYFVPCNNVGALQTAITNANSTPTTTDTINLAPGCPYQLTSPLPSVQSPIVINGNGATLTRTAASKFRILTVDGGNLTLRAATVSNGDVTGHTGAVEPGAGGGIVVTGGGKLTASASRIQGNQADFGGGLSVFGGSSAELDATTVTSNHAVNNGGGIASDGTLTVVASNIVRNTASIGGGLANLSPGKATLTLSNVSNNTATNGPGGIFNNAGPTGVTLQLTSVAANTPSNCGGTVPGCVN